MRGTRVKALRTAARPHPGRKHGGPSRAVAVGRRVARAKAARRPRLFGRFDDDAGRTVRRQSWLARHMLAFLGSWVRR